MEMLKEETTITDNDSTSSTNEVDVLPAVLIRKTQFPPRISEGWKHVGKSARGKQQHGRSREDGKYRKNHSNAHFRKGSAFIRHSDTIPGSKQTSEFSGPDMHLKDSEPAILASEAISLGAIEEEGVPDTSFGSNGTGQVEFQGEKAEDDDIANEFEDRGEYDDDNEAETSGESDDNDDREAILSDCQANIDVVQNSAEPQKSDQVFKVNRSSAERIEDLQGTHTSLNQFQKMGAVEIKKYHIWDYGGQRVFYSLHHLFMTKYGVYLIIFDMSQIMDKDTETKDSCLLYIRFWLNSVWAHARRVDDNGTVSCCKLILVGTHKDIVVSAEQHNEIATIMANEFSMHPVWKFLVQCKGQELLDALSFFPIDNTQASEDPVIQQLMNCVEEISKDVSEQDYINLRVPKEWFKALDRFQSLSSGVVSLKYHEEVIPICQECNMPSSFFASAVSSFPEEQHLEIETRAMLQFFHELGRVMYFDEDAVKNLVILRPVDFIFPVTRLICRHDTLHKPSNPELTLRTDWQALVEKGILTRDLMHQLWSDRVEHCDELEYLMVKFGLMVPMKSSWCSFHKDCYVVPAIHSHEERKGSQFQKELLYRQEKKEQIFTFFMLFADREIMNKWEEDRCVTHEEAHNQGFLPDGVFPRLICKAVAWSQYIACNPVSTIFGHDNKEVEIEKLPQTFDLGSREAKIIFGDHTFIVEEFPEYGYIRVNVLVESVFIIAKILEEKANKVLDECIPAVRCRIAVAVNGENTIGTNIYKGVLVLLTSNGAVVDQCKQSGSITLDLSRQRQNPCILKQIQALPFMDIISEDPLKFKLHNLKQRFRNWLPPVGKVEECGGKNQTCQTAFIDLPCMYDVFFSYRQKPFESDLTDACFCNLSNMTGAPLSFSLLKGKKLHAFLDKFRLPTGRNFETEFTEALLRSEIFVPIISSETLLGFLDLKEQSRIDNVLLEWTLAVELLELELKKCCFPILIGSVKNGSKAGDTVFSNLFQDCIMNGEIVTNSTQSYPLIFQKLPNIVCSKVVKKVQDLFRKWKKKYVDFPDPTVDLPDRTVKETVEYLTKHLTKVMSWEIEAKYRQSISTSEINQKVAVSMSANHIREQLIARLYQNCSLEIFNLAEEAAVLREKARNEAEEKAKWIEEEKMAKIKREIQEKEEEAAVAREKARKEAEEKQMTQVMREKQEKEACDLEADLNTRTEVDDQLICRSETIGPKMQNSEVRAEDSEAEFQRLGNSVEKEETAQERQEKEIVGSRPVVQVTAPATELKQSLVLTTCIPLSDSIRSGCCIVS